MSTQKVFGTKLMFTCTFALCALITLATLRTTVAQNNNVFLQNNIGGVVVDPDGILQNQPVHLDTELQRELLAKLRLAPGELQEDVELRKISLRRMQEAIAVSLSKGEPIPQEVQLLAGLHRIQFILVYPEERDILLAGPGGGWTADDDGRILGSHGKPVLQLDDLIVAMRTIFGTGNEMISCSINPTEAGLQQYQEILFQQSLFQPNVLPALERALGPQDITVTGVPATSHFAQVLVAADYRMKRIAMGLDPSPVQRLTSYLKLVKSARSVKSAMPRWWLACNYESLARSEDGLAWEIRGSGVKCLAESALLEPNGTVGKGKGADQSIHRWAEQMTSEFEPLSEKEPVFTELQQLMDFCVLAALIREKGLHLQAQCDLSLLADDASGLETYAGNAPRKVPSQASVVKRGRNYIISASGGVEIDAWSIVQQSELSRDPEAVHASAAGDGRQSTWWWD